MSGRGWKLDLGDHRSDLTDFQHQLTKRGKAGKAAAKGGSKRKHDGPTWKPGASAKRVGVEGGVRLASYVARQQGGISVREAKRLIETGVVRVDGRVETFASRQLRQGETVEVFAELAPAEHVFDPKRVIYDSPAFMAYDKPAWLPVTPTDQTKSWALIHILKAALGPELIPVHRIDADTSGVVLFAKQERAARRLEEAFRDHEVHKTYLAIVRGHPRASGEHRSYLVQKDKGQGFERWESGHGADARAAVTTWEVQEELGPFGALVRVQPKTGRHHQIRIHFAEMGHPLYGDRRHGDRTDPVQAPRHMLHAWKVDVPDPDGGEAIRIVAPKPREFDELAEQLRRLKR